jgi:hypothetical protein
MADEKCEHRFVYQGVVYTHDQYPLPGTGARARTYHDVYFCEKCLTTVQRNPRRVGTSYEPPMAGAMPGESENGRW